MLLNIKDRYLLRKAHHLSNLPLECVMFEIMFNDMIHPKETDSFKDILTKSPIVSWDNNNEILENSGIYAITFNNKTFYIGETSNTFYTRFQQHKEELENGTHYNHRLQRGNNHGGKPTIYLLEYAPCPPECRTLFKIYSLIREFYYQQLALKDNFGLNNIEDTLKRLYINYHSVYPLGGFFVSSCESNYVPKNYKEILEAIYGPNKNWLVENYVGTKIFKELMDIIHKPTVGINLRQSSENNKNNPTQD